MEITGDPTVPEFRERSIAAESDDAEHGQGSARSVPRHPRPDLILSGDPALSFLGVRKPL